MGMQMVGDYRHLAIQDTDGVMHTIVLPKSAVLDPQFNEASTDDLPCEISLHDGQLIADFVPREDYLNYDDLITTAEQAVVAIENEMLHRSLVYCGEYGYEGDGVLIDAKLLGDASVPRGTIYLDDGPTKSRLSVAGGFVAIPFRFTLDQSCEQKRMNGIVFDLRPNDSRYKDEPVAAPQDRRRQRV
jgi:hypothetical protein